MPISFRRLATLSSLLAALLLALPPRALEAQAARIALTVLDPGGAPLPDVAITVTTPERGDVKIETTTNKKGKATLMVPNVTLNYDLVLQLDGYQEVRTQVKPRFGETTFREYQMTPAAGGPALEAAESHRTFTPAETAFNAGVELLSEESFDAALEKFLEARDKDPNLAPVHSALAAIYLEKGQPQEALVSAQRFLEAEPSNPRGLRLMYDAYRALGNEAEAAKMLKQLQSLKGADVAVLLFNEGVEAVKVGDIESAEQRFLEALEAQPDLFQATDALLVVYGRKGQWEKVAQQAESVLAHQPDNLRALRARWEAYGKLGDTAKEKEALQALAKVDPTSLAGSLYDSGVAKFNANDTEGAIADLERALEIDPTRAGAHYFLGLCYTNTSSPDQAKSHLTRFLELAPDDPNAASAREMLKYLK